jgi:thioredoxin reductase
MGENDREFDVIVFAVGRDPNLDFLSNALKSDARRLEGEGLLHFIGDVRNGRSRQAAIAVGDGVRTALLIAEKRAQEGT